ncbi:MAG TPA: transglutaminase-like domain-containing protein [Vicinamibacterales bacterium]|nr:transglutaminase-like domain-containing protein [Vicinamibacterales bacterium]
MSFNAYLSRPERREFLRVTALSSASLVTSSYCPLLEGASTPNIAGCRLMEFDVSYTTEISSLPRDAKVFSVWMPLPSTDHAQDISNVQIESSLSYDVTQTEAFFSDTLHVHAKASQAPCKIEARYHIARSRVGVHAEAVNMRDLANYLQTTRTVRMTPDIEDFATRIIGEASHPLEIGRRVFRGIQSLLTYDNTIPGCGTGDTAWIMKHHRGKCDDYHALFMAIMVSRGIPVRWEQGFPLPFPDETTNTGGQIEGDCTGSHCWVSFYVPEYGWVPVDVSEADKTPFAGDFYFGNLTPNRFQVSTGRSVVLNPKQGGDPLPSFAFSYAEADGIPLVYLVNYQNIISYSVTNVEFS